MTLEETYTRINQSSLEAQLSDMRQRLAEMGIQKAILRLLTRQMLTAPWSWLSK